MHLDKRHMAAVIFKGSVDTEGLKDSVRSSQALQQTKYIDKVSASRFIMNWLNINGSQYNLYQIRGSTLYLTEL